MSILTLPGMGRALPHTRAQRPDRAAAAQVAVRVLRTTTWALLVLSMTTMLATLAVPLWYQARHEKLLVVTSGSMAPYIEAGDAVVMREVTNPAQLRVGQVVTFHPMRGQKLVTHRIVSMDMLPVLTLDKKTGRMVPVTDPISGKVWKRPYIQTKGDANAKVDADRSPVSAVRGIVRDVKPGWGRVIGWSQSREGRVALFVPPLLGLAAAEVVALWRERGTDDDADTPGRRIEDGAVQA